MAIDSSLVMAYMAIWFILTIVGCWAAMNYDPPGDSYGAWVVMVFLWMCISMIALVWIFILPFFVIAAGIWFGRRLVKRR